MSNKAIAKKAADEVAKEILRKKIQEVKESILKTLDKIEGKKKEKDTVEEQLRILKLDLDDLRKGNFDKIAKRQKQSGIAHEISIPLPTSWTTNTVHADWTYISPTSFTGTYGRHSQTFYQNTSHTHDGSKMMNLSGHSHASPMNDNESFWINATGDTYKTKSGKVYFF